MTELATKGNLTLVERQTQEGGLFAPADAVNRETKAESIALSFAGPRSL
jgi:hypothetical protein